MLCELEHGTSGIDSGQTCDNVVVHARMIWMLFVLQKIS